MKGARARELVTGALILLFAAGATAQGDEDLSRTVDRLVGAQDPPQTRVDLGLACLEELKERPDPGLEREVRLAIGLALSGLERFREARIHLVAAEALARQTGDQSCLAHCLWERAVQSWRLGEFDDAIASSEECLEVAQAVQRLDIRWRAANILGLTLGRTGEPVRALEAFTRGLEAAEELGDSAGAAVLLGNIGMSRMNLGEYEQALELLGRAQEIQRDMENRYGLPSTVANLGDLHFLMDELDASLEYHQEALKLREELGFEAEVSRSQHSLGAIRYAQEEYELALQHFERALATRRRLEMAPEQAETLGAMALVFAALDRGEEALDSVELGLDLSEQLEMKGRRLALLEALSRVHEEQGELAMAMEVLRDAVTIEREQRSLETRQAIARFQANLEAREQEL